MKNSCPLLCFALSAGTLAALSAWPSAAAAQLVGGFRRPGAVVQGQPVPQAPPVQPASAPIQPSFPVQQSFPMRSGAMERGGPVPQMRPAPPVQVYSSAPPPSLPYGFRRPPIVSMQSSGPASGWQRNGGNNSGNTNTYSNDANSGGWYDGRGPVVTLPDGPYYPTGGGNYTGGSYGVTTVPPVGPANGFFRNPVPPVGPANGFGGGQAPMTGGGGPALLGGYYYGGYCSDGGSGWRHTYRSVYSQYGGPQYIYSPSVVIVTNNSLPDYAAPPVPFYAPVYQTTYNQNNYYVAAPERIDDLQAGGARAKAALQHAYPANSYQAAFADIAHAWTDSDIELIRKHLRDPETRVSVFLSGKYSYSIASSDFSQITRDALDRLNTVSFQFTRLRKAKNGDVTAFGVHVYRAPGDNGADTNGTVPFDQAEADTSGTDGLGASKTLYVSYTLRRYGNEWDIIATDSAGHDLAAVSPKASE